MSVSAAGFVGGPDSDLSWVFPTIDGEVTNWLVDVLGNAGTHIMGHSLYEVMPHTGRRRTTHLPRQ
ncbi:MAG: hypothetical protein HY043_10740 [Verrucomicrobia bacterium]|nr:hypothetical protein [Verrucomicrobiota bacterium]